MSSPRPPSAHPVPKPTAPATRDLVRALSAVNHKVPEVGLALLEEKISPASQRRFAWLLLEVAEALLLHANPADGLSVYPHPPS